MRDDAPIDSDHGAGWLPAKSAVLQSVTDPDTRTQSHSGDEWGWLDRHGEAPDADTRRRAPGRRAAWIALCVAVIVVGAVVGVGVTTVTDRSDTVAETPTLTATPPTTAEATDDACAGLTGHSVTAGPGDPRSMPGVIAAFEHAYYHRRDAEAALRLVAPEAALDAAALSAGISSIPPGTTHCVAITPIADTAAEVHLVQRHRDSSRIDYLQLINTRLAPTGDMLITNIQKRA